MMFGVFSSYIVGELILPIIGQPVFLASSTVNPSSLKICSASKDVRVSSSKITSISVFAEVLWPIF